MKKKDWGNAVWFLFHTLAEKLKPEYTSEIPILVSHITNICENLPCPDCKDHASSIMKSANKTNISKSKETLIEFLWNFHNNVNHRIKSNFFKKDELIKYKSAITVQIIKNFISVMSQTTNNEKTMLHGFHRFLYIKKFVEYIQGNIHKYDM